MGPSSKASSTGTSSPRPEAPEAGPPEGSGGISGRCGAREACPLNECRAAQGVDPLPPGERMKDWFCPPDKVQAPEGGLRVRGASGWSPLPRTDNQGEPFLHRVHRGGNRRCLEGLFRVQDE